MGDRTSIEIIFHDIDTNQVEDINICFRDKRPYTTVTEREDESGSYVFKQIPQNIDELEGSVEF